MTDLFDKFWPEFSLWERVEFLELLLAGNRSNEGIAISFFEEMFYHSTNFVFTFHRI